MYNVAVLQDKNLIRPYLIISSAKYGEQFVPLSAAPRGRCDPRPTIGVTCIDSLSQAKLGAY